MTEILGVVAFFLASIACVGVGLLTWKRVDCEKHIHYHTTETTKSRYPQQQMSWTYTSKTTKTVPVKKTTERKTT